MWFISGRPGRGRPQAQTLIDSYAEAGVTWWIETLPLEAQAFAPIRERVRRGPLLRAF